MRKLGIWDFVGLVDVVELRICEMGRQWWCCGFGLLVNPLVPN